MSAALIAFSLCASLAPGKVLEVKSANNIDEQLFLTYALNDLYGELPTNYSDSQLVTKELDDLRFRTNRYLEYAQRRKFDPDLIGCFSDLLQCNRRLCRFSGKHRTYSTTGG